ncbi:hypothetical protein Naga_100123g1 [Nannochloropsis gaditana]|uniref:Uncharacterized protein n=1 Tax=Nannochloropsis gaditana TaxID=72520 RepID=W7TES3_9STRA|nr:hypothetical protein Naga_100123g1 [Nannochloropsis gaditana]
MEAAEALLASVRGPGPPPTAKAEPEDDFGGEEQSLRSASQDEGDGGAGTEGGSMRGARARGGLSSRPLLDNGVPGARARKGSAAGARGEGGAPLGGGRKRTLGRAGAGEGESDEGSSLTPELCAQGSKRAAEGVSSVPAAAAEEGSGASAQDGENRHKGGAGKAKRRKR